MMEHKKKIKVSRAEIVVHGTKEKPYYEIKYHDLSDGKTHIGYSSYNLNFVFEWLEEFFEIMPEKEINRMSTINELVSTLRTLAGLQNKQHHERIINRAADIIESLSAKLADMERSKERSKKMLKYGFCPDCGASVGRGVSSCFECGAVLDWDLIKKYGAASGGLQRRKRKPLKRGRYCTAL